MPGRAPDRARTRAGGGSFAALVAAQAELLAHFVSRKRTLLMRALDELLAGFAERQRAQLGRSTRRAAASMTRG
jgi:hypothetical protein